MLVDEPASVDQPEEQEQKDGEDERELDQCLPPDVLTGHFAAHNETVFETVSEPAELVTVNRTVHEPLLLGNAWKGFCALVMPGGVVSLNSHNHVVIGQAAGADDRSLNVTFRRGEPVVQVKLATGAGHGDAVGVGLGDAVAVGVGPGDPEGLGLGDGEGLGVGAANGTVTERIAVRDPPWFVTSSVME